MNESPRDALIARLLGLGVIVLFVSAAFTPLPNFLADWLEVPPEPGPADAIAVLGGGGPFSQHRAVRGIVLYRKGLAPLVVFSGFQAGPPPWEHQRRAALARQLGVPDDAILSVSGRTTRDEIARIGRLLRLRSARTVLLVTDPQHMARAKPLFERAGFKVLVAPTDELSPPAATPEGRLQLARRTLAEICALLSYRVAGYL